MLSLPRSQVQSLVGELRFCKLYSTTKLGKKKKKKVEKLNPCVLRRLYGQGFLQRKKAARSWAQRLTNYLPFGGNGKRSRG